VVGLRAVCKRVFGCESRRPYTVVTFLCNLSKSSCAPSTISTANFYLLMRRRMTDEIMRRLVEDVSGELDACMDQYSEKFLNTI
jgi:hypothetical protein